MCARMPGAALSTTLARCVGERPPAGAATGSRDRRRPRHPGTWEFLARTRALRSYGRGRNHGLPRGHDHYESGRNAIELAAASQRLTLR